MIAENVTRRPYCLSSETVAAIKAGQIIPASVLSWWVDAKKEHDSNQEILRRHRELKANTNLTPPKQKRRPSITKIIEQANKLGMHVSINADGAVTVFPGADNAPERNESWWDRKVK